MSQWLDDAARPIQAGMSGWPVVSPDHKKAKGLEGFLSNPIFG
jgi:hypothetical protein